MSLNINALFSDESEAYRFPAEPDENSRVQIKFRAKKDDLNQVYLIMKQDVLSMEKFKSEGLFDYFRVELKIGTETVHYYFQIEKDNIIYYYHKRGVTTNVNECAYFGIVPGFKTPDWANGAVMYQIFTDRFYNGDTSNDVVDREYIYIKDGTVKVNDWSKYPDTNGEKSVREFYGGDLQGVMEKLDYLKELGIDAIYFNPLFVSPSNHKYDIQDYDYIDPHFGIIVNDNEAPLEPREEKNIYATKFIERVTNKENLEASNRLFITLVEEIHKRGMKVILDGVFNHSGSFNKWMDAERIYENEQGYEKGAFISADSPYRSFFKFNSEDEWPYNKNYDGWWGHSTLPKLNYEESKLLVKYILDIAKKWVSPPFNVDGWRLDVAADLGHSSVYNHCFWREFRKTVKSANPDAIILAEHYGDPAEWLQGDQWDTVMNYNAFMEPLTWFLTGMEKHSDEYRADLLGNGEAFENAMKYHMSKLYGPSLYTSMNQLSNHDHSRFLTRTNRLVGRTDTLGPEAASMGVNKGVFREAVVIQMTWPGAPTLYYGDEAGVCGFTDPDNRRTYPWGKEDYELIEFHRDMIRIRKENKVLRTGSIKLLNTGYNILCYGRFDEENQVIIIVNNNPHEADISVPVWEVGFPMEGQLEQVMCTTETGYSIGIVEFGVNVGVLAVRMEKISAMVLVNKN